MAAVVTNGSVIQCSFGMAPTPLTILPVKRVMAGSQPVAAITDIVPFLNISPFGACTSLMNPTVAAATAAAFGALTPMPCTPLVAGPWAPGSPTVMTGGVPAVTSTSQCMCSYGGVIKVSMPSQMTVMAP